MAFFIHNLIVEAKPGKKSHEKLSENNITSVKVFKAKNIFIL